MLQQIEDRLRGHHPPTNEIVTNRASVLSPLSLYRGEPSLLLTRRSAELRSFSGHVSFPGGKRDQEDKSDYCTSLRESREEVGLEQVQIRFVGELGFPYALSGSRHTETERHRREGIRHRREL